MHIRGCVWIKSLIKSMFSKKSRFSPTLPEGLIHTHMFEILKNTMILPSGQYPCATTANRSTSEDEIWVKFPSLTDSSTHSLTHRWADTITGRVRHRFWTVVEELKSHHKWWPKAELVLVSILFQRIDPSLFLKKNTLSLVTTARCQLIDEVVFFCFCFCFCFFLFLFLMYTTFNVSLLYTEQHSPVWLNSLLHY